MAIIKASLHSNYVQIPNKTMQDSTLSYEARGMLGMLLSMPSGWEVNKSWVVDQSPAGKDKVNSIFDELINAGYIRKSETQRKHGKFTSDDYFIFPSPERINRSGETVDGLPAPIKETVINKQDIKETSIVHSDESTALDDCFELFWKSGMKKLNKKKALSAFKTAFKNAKPKLKTDNKEDEFAAYLVRDVQKRIKNKQFGFDRLHPVTYLNGERWHDEYTNADGKSVMAKSDFPEQQGADRPIHVIEARATLTADDREQLKNQRGKLAELMGNL